METKTDPACLARHIGLWMIEPLWLTQAVSSIRAHTWPINARAEPRGMDDLTDVMAVADGLATISIDGPMMKADSKFGGVNTIRVRRAIREAASDESVKAILLHVDSPGGTVAGTEELAADVRAADGVKPVFAHIDDFGASAAFWVASQARRLTANATAEIGSIGTIAVIEDSSAAAEMEGITVHVISTGAFKGLGAPGAPVTPEHLAYLTERVEALNEHFLKGVQAGRKMSMSQVRAVADGRVHIASAARSLGLIDAVGSLDEVRSKILGSIKPRRRSSAVARRRLDMIG